ncbi:MAG: bifunctional alpha,alpha-trehalose-phosphate synthase (UDP-forming)/trehalose-phosphatase [Acidilobus sp.]
MANRLPYTLSVTGEEVRLRPSTGGLATGMRQLLEGGQGVWVGWPGTASEGVSDQDGVTRTLRTRGIYPVWLTAKEVEGFYEGFCNGTLWPLFHYFVNRAIFSSDHWQWYERVNEKFAEAASSVYRPGDVIWVHDYQLMLVPLMLRRRLGDDAIIGFFLHIPFPSFEVFRVLPWRKELLRGVLGADLVGFHTYDYVNHFLESVRRILGLEHTLGVVNFEGRLVRVDAFPMGVDYRSISSRASSQEVLEKVKELRGKLGDVKVVFSIDRLDYTKGLPERLLAFWRLLEGRQEYRGKVTYVFVVSPSRERVSEYAKLASSLNELVGEINGHYGTLGWTPVIYIRRFISDEELLALYRVADVALITPLRDGMNLVAKEYVAANVDRNGVLIVSEGAGVSAELVEALVVNPYDYDGVADALQQALDMPPQERAARMASLQQRVASYDVSAWAQDFMSSLLSVKEEQARAEEELRSRRLSGTALTMASNTFMVSRRRVFFLDYDGTLVPMTQTPENATLTPEAKEILTLLTTRPNTDVVLITTRPRRFMEGVVKEVPDLQVATENGAWIYTQWSWTLNVSKTDVSWKAEVMKIMESYTRRTPGAFVEEKEYSVTWHYRNAPPSIGEARAAELFDVLSRFVAVHRDLSVVRGPKAIEVRLAELSKPRAASYWLSRKQYDFIFAAGDSQDDEDLFSALPPGSITVRVGRGPTRATYYVNDPAELISVLRSIASV